MSLILLLCINYILKNKCQCLYMFFFLLTIWHCFQNPLSECHKFFISFNSQLVWVGRIFSHNLLIQVFSTSQSKQENKCPKDPGDVWMTVASRQASDVLKFPYEEFEYNWIRMGNSKYCLGNCDLWWDECLLDFFSSKTRFFKFNFQWKSQNCVVLEWLIYLSQDTSVFRLCCPCIVCSFVSTVECIIL